MYKKEKSDNEKILQKITLAVVVLNMKKSSTT